MPGAGLSEKPEEDDSFVNHSLTKTKSMSLTSL